MLMGEEASQERRACTDRATEAKRMSGHHAKNNGFARGPGQGDPSQMTARIDDETVSVPDDVVVLRERPLLLVDDGQVDQVGVPVEVGWVEAVITGKGARSTVQKIGVGAGRIGFPRTRTCPERGRRLGPCVAIFATGLVITAIVWIIVRAG